MESFNDSFSYFFSFGLFLSVLAIYRSFSRLFSSPFLFGMFLLSPTRIFIYKFFILSCFPADIMNK